MGIHSLLLSLIHFHVQYIFHFYSLDVQQQSEKAENKLYIFLVHCENGSYAPLKKGK